MEEFITLKTILENEISSLKEALSNIQNQYDTAKKLKDVINNIYNAEIKLIDVEHKILAKEMFPETADLINLIDTLSDYETFLKLRRYSAIYNNVLIETLTKVGISQEKINSIINELEYCRELDEIISDPLYDDESMKNSVMQSNQTLVDIIDSNYHALIEKLIDSLKEKYNDNYGDNFEEYLTKINDIQSKIDELEKMNAIFDKNGLISFFENRQSLERLYAWMESKIDPELQIKIVIAITKYSLLKSLGKDTQEDIDNAIERNHEDVIAELQDTTKTETQISFDTLDMSQFDINEQAIISRMRDVYKMLLSKTQSRFNFISQDESQFVNREEYYLVDDKYNWDIILADIEDNLLPNIYINKELVFNAFKLIINLVNKRVNEISEINIGIAKLNEYLGQLNPLMRYADKYDTKYDYLIENNYDINNELFGFQVSYEFVDMGYYLKHTLQNFINELCIYKDNYQKSLSNNLILLDSDKFDDSIIRENFVKILEECNKKIVAYQITQQERFKPTEEIKKDYDFSENLVFCIENFELTTEGHRSELRETLKEFTGKNSRQLENAGNTRREKLATIKRKTETGKEIEYDDPRIKPYCKFFLPCRYAGQADYRTGLIYFNKVHPEIKRKIQERYNLSDQCSIYGLFMVIEARNSNHNEYKDFEDYINDNMSKIDELGEMFADPNTDINMLYRIIDDGIKKKENLISDKEY